MNLITQIDCLIIDFIVAVIVRHSNVVQHQKPTKTIQAVLHLWYVDFLATNSLLYNRLEALSIYETNKHHNSHCRKRKTNAADTTQSQPIDKLRIKDCVYMCMYASGR